MFVCIPRATPLPLRSLVIWRAFIFLKAAMGSTAAGRTWQLFTQWKQRRQSLHSGRLLVRRTPDAGRGELLRAPSVHRRHRHRAGDFDELQLAYTDNDAMLAASGALAHHMRQQEQAGIACAHVRRSCCALLRKK